MNVQSKMVSDVVTIEPSDSLNKAFKAMQEHNVSQLPVVHEGTFVGLVTDSLLAEFTPSKATTLSIYELTYVLGKTQAQDIMIKDAITCSPEDLIEIAALKMNENDVNMIPVIDSGRKLLGIISRFDIIEAFINMLGSRDTGTRISLLAKDETGTIAEISSIIKKYGISITHLANFQLPGSDEGELVIRMNTNDVSSIVDDLKDKGYKLLRIDQNQTG